MLESDFLGSNPSSAPNYVPLGSLLNLSVSQLLYMQNGDDDSTHLIGLDTKM